MNNVDDLISMKECRILREAVHALTVSPILTKSEYLEITLFLEKAFERLEKENVN